MRVIFTILIYFLALWAIPLAFSPNHRYPWMISLCVILRSLNFLNSLVKNIQEKLSLFFTNLSHTSRNKRMEYLLEYIPLLSMQILSLGLAYFLLGNFPRVNPHLGIIVFLSSWAPLCLCLERKRNIYTEVRREEWAEENFSLTIFDPRKIYAFLLWGRSLLSLFLPIFYLWAIIALRWAQLGQKRFLWDSFLLVLNFIHQYPPSQPLILATIYLLMEMRKNVSWALKQESYSVHWSLLSYLYFSFPLLDILWDRLLGKVNKYLENPGYLSRIISHFIDYPLHILWLGTILIPMEFILTQGSLCYSLIFTFFSYIFYLLLSLYSFLFYLNREALQAPEALLRRKDFPLEDARERSLYLRDIHSWDHLKIYSLDLYIPRFKVYFPSWVYWHRNSAWIKKERLFFPSHE